MSEASSIFVFEPHAASLKSCAGVVEEAGYVAAPAATPEEATAQLEDSTHDALLIAHGQAGIELSQYVREFTVCRAPLLVMLDRSSTAAARDAALLEMDADGFLLRPFSAGTLQSLLSMSHRMKALSQRLADLERESESAPQLRRLASAINSRTGFYQFEFIKDLLVVEVRRAKRYGYPLAIILVGLDAIPALHELNRPTLQREITGGLAVAIAKSIRDIDLPIHYADDRILVFLPHTDLAGPPRPVDRRSESPGDLCSGHGAPERRRLLISDLDGTLLLPDRSLGPRSRVAIERHLERGGLFTIATGRSSASAAAILGELAALLPVDAIVHNGAARVRLSTGAVRETTLIPGEVAVRLFREAVEAGICPVAYAPEPASSAIRHGGAPNRATERYLEALAPLHAIARDDTGASLRSGVLSMILLDEPDRLDGLLGARCPALGLGYSVGRSAYTAGLGVGEVQSAAASKATAALALARELGLEASALCAFGDNMNDLPLLLAAGEAYCPPDAVPGVLEAVAGRIAPAAEEGVARFLEALDTRPGGAPPARAL